MKRTNSTSISAKRLVLRRIALGSGLAFALLLTAGGYWLFTPPSPYVPLSGLDPASVSMIAVGDQGSGDLQQWRVGQAMEHVAAREGRLDMVVFLGDNFYG
ncbi:MAG: metallophosphoesterase, partial [Pseudomonas sp.]